MIKFVPKYFSIIFLGRQNPQILSHDFLLKNSILPLDKPPFIDIEKKSIEEKPFDGFISTPVLTNLTYKNINIAIEESRFQITDNLNIDPANSPVSIFTKNYFSVLKYTPLSAGGINFSGHILFDSLGEKTGLEDKFISARNGFYKDLGISDFEASLKILFPFNQNKIELTVSRLRANELAKLVNFNYEFAFKDINSFLSNLDEAGVLFDKFNAILTKLGVK